MKPLKAVVWKEVRENLVLPVLVWVLIGLSFFYNLNPIYALSHSWEKFWPEVFTVPFSLLSPVFAVALAISQSVRELGRDQWAFLVHRPLSRGNLFMSKAVAGLGLYLATCFLALLVAAYWCSRPQVLNGPVILGVLWPSVIGVLGGVPYYFATTLVIMRPAMWYRSRALPLVSALVCSGITVAVDFLSHALLTQIIFSALLGVAAWGNFIRREELKRQPRVAQAALGGVLGLGIAVLLLVGLVIGVERLEEQRRVQPDQRIYANSGTWFFSALHFNAAEHFDSMTAGEINFRTYAGLEFGSPKFRETYPYKDPKTFAIPLPGGGYDERWYFVPSQGVLRGWSAETNRELGCIGVSGFAESGQSKPQRFPGHWIPHAGLISGGVLVFTGGVYAVDIESRTVRELIRAEVNDEIRAADIRPVAVVDQSQVKSRHLGAVLRGHKLVIFKLEEKAGITLSLPADLDDFHWATVQIPATPRSHYEVLLLRRWSGGPRNRISHRSLKFDRTGKLQGESTLEPNYPAPNYAPSLPENPAFGALLGGTVPPAVMTAMMGRLLTRDAPAAPADKDWRLGWQRNRPFLLVTVLMSALSFLVSASLATRIAIRCGFEKHTQWKWAIVSALLGPLGVFTMLSLLAWPPRVLCPNCKRKRLVILETCEHCSASWPQITRDGTEIFRDAETQQEVLSA